MFRWGLSWVYTLVGNLTHRIKIGRKGKSLLWFGGRNSLIKKRLFCEIASTLCWKILCILRLPEIHFKTQTCRFFAKFLEMASILHHCKKLPPVCGNLTTDTLWVNCMLGYSGKWHQSSVGKFTVVYNVHINYAMTKIFVACVLLSL